MSASLDPASPLNQQRNRESPTQIAGSVASVPGSPLNLEGGRKEATRWVPQEGGGREQEVQTAAQLTGSGNRVPGVRLQSGERHGSWSRHQKPAILSYCRFKSDFFFFKGSFLSLSVQGEEKRNQRGGAMVQ